jgi:hypothetical protein
MKSKITLATVALAALMLAMPTGAEAGFHKRGWKKCGLELWFRHDRTRKVVKVKGKKKYAKKAAKRAKKKS